MTARPCTLALLLAPLLGCGDDPEFWQPRHALLPMVALDDRVAFVERTSRTAFLLDPADPTLTPRQVPVGEGPVLAVKRNGQNQLLVVASGARGSSDQPEIPPQLDLIDAATPAAGGRPAATYPLTGRYDALAQSSDGRLLVLYHSPGGQAKAEAPLFNPNEMTLVNFDLTPPTRSKTIRSMGGVPTGVAFSPPFLFKAGPRVLGVVTSESYVTVLDLDNPGNHEISLPLCPQTSGCTLTPAQVAFDPDNLAIYLRVHGASDIYQVTLTDTVPDEPGENPFSASLSMLAVGAVPADMAVYGAGKNGTRIAVAAPDRQRLVIIDPSTSSATSVATAIPVSQIVAFELPPLPPATQPRQQALLVDRTAGSPSVLFAELDQVSIRGGLALREYSLGAGVTGMQPLVEQGIVVLVGGKLSGSAAVTVVELASRSFSAFGTASELSQPSFELRHPSRLWHVDQNTGLCYLNLSERPSQASLPDGEARLTTGETWLDQVITGIVPLASSSTEITSDATRYLVAVHADPNGVGNLTLLDAEKPDRAKARAAYGFLLTNYLDREQP